jgi:structural maintenance of chromosome 2
MQGRITKVVNMKPLEVLSMIEEAAGTRMYENKKKNAQRTIQKKQSKVDEINKILHEEITPTLERLRKDRSLFMQWSNNNTEIERLARCVPNTRIDASAHRHRHSHSMRWGVMLYVVNIDSVSLLNSGN